MQHLSEDAAPFVSVGDHGEKRPDTCHRGSDEADERDRERF